MSVDIGVLKIANAKRWTVAHTLPAFGKILDDVSDRLIALKAKEAYQLVETGTGVPWYVIAVIHEREASQSWLANLAQGDPWNKRSVHIPKNRGPFHSWGEAAVDALTNCPPYAARWKDWSIGGLLTLLEEYNGLGYAMRNLPSPYIWSGTDQYHRGKFIADGHFDPAAVDQQIGCAALLKRMVLQDTSIKLGA